MFLTCFKQLRVQYTYMSTLHHLPKYVDFCLEKKCYQHDLLDFVDQCVFQMFMFLLHNIQISV